MTADLLAERNQLRVKLSPDVRARIGISWGKGQGTTKSA